MHAFTLLAEMQVESNPDAPGVVATATGAGIAVFLLWFFNWVVGHSLVLAHEGGHAMMAVALGGRVKSIKTKSNLTGATDSGHPKGFGTLDTLVRQGSGYIAPPVFGLVAADLLGHGKADVVLWGTIVLYVIMIPSLRSWWAFFSTVVTVTVFLVVVAQGDEQYKVLSAVIWAWLLIAGGLFSLLEHFLDAGDFHNMAQGSWPIRLFLFLAYTAATIAVMIYAGLILIGAVDPFF